MHVLLGLFVMLSFQVVAEFVPLSEQAMSQATGQAFVAIDREEQSNINYTKVSLGLDINTRMSASKVELGKYNRSGEVSGSSDILIDNFALGHIDNNGNEVPFNIKDPYVELAYDANETIVGFRLGFGEAFGKLSGDIRSLTGDVDISIYGKGSYLADKISCGWDFLICLPAKGLVGSVWANSDFAAQAELIDESTGQADPIRATHVGILNGQSLSIPSGGGFTNFLLGIFSSSNCDLLGVNTCFPLTSYKTLDIGDVATNTPAQGMYISFQAQSLKWDGKTVPSGVFMNIPNGGVVVSFPDALNGIDRARTRYYE